MVNDGHHSVHKTLVQNLEGSLAPSQKTKVTVIRESSDLATSFRMRFIIHFENFQFHIYQKYDCIPSIPNALKILRVPLFSCFLCFLESLCHLGYGIFDRRTLRNLARLAICPFWEMSTQLSPLFVRTSTCTDAHLFKLNRQSQTETTRGYN